MAHKREDQQEENGAPDRRLSHGHGLVVRGSGRATTARALMHEWRLIGRRRRLTAAAGLGSSGRAPERALAPEMTTVWALTYLIAAIDCARARSSAGSSSSMPPRRRRSPWSKLRPLGERSHRGMLTLGTRQRIRVHRQSVQAGSLRARDRASPRRLPRSTPRAKPSSSSWFSKLKDRCIWLNEFQTSTRRGR